MLLSATDDAVTGLWFEGQKYFPTLPAGAVDGSDRLVVAARDQVLEYLDGRRQAFDLPVQPAGTPFQQQVWSALAAVPFGRTTTYADLARGLGRPTATRAVGAAVGRNPISLIVPCHRVLGTDGSLTGYAGGLERKSALLQLEGTF